MRQIAMAELTPASNLSGKGGSALSTVAVVVPWSMRSTLTSDEEISLRHLEHFLGKHDRYIVAPRSIKVSRDGFQCVSLPDKFFGSVKAHSQLQVSERFYEIFHEYKFILMHHLDALVLSDQLLDWCERGWDYIGAPWLRCEDSPWVRHPRVGNSGFALMKVESFLAVMRSRQWVLTPQEIWKARKGQSRIQRLIHRSVDGMKQTLGMREVKSATRKWVERSDGGGNTDLFWSDQAVRYWPAFKVAPFSVGLEFAFEVAPRVCFELNNRKLPFGCHAWPRYDRAFWEPYLLK